MDNIRSINTLKITVTSGKGGVGKSFLTANIAYLLSMNSTKTIIYDADSQFPNQHLIIGSEPPLRLSQVYAGLVSVEHAIFKINDNLDLLADMPAAGLAEHYTDDKIIEAFSNLLHYSEHDVILFDSPSGAGDEVLQTAGISDLIIIVINDEPTSLLDAYGLIKILKKLGYDEKIRLIVNNVIDFEDAEEMSEKLNLATGKFLKKSYNSIGFVPYDRAVRRSIIEQELLVISEPYSEVVNALNSICGNILSEINLLNI